MNEWEPDYVKRVGAAIIEKYGKETLTSPKANWTIAKELHYLKQIKKISRRKQKEIENDKINIEGVLIPKKLFMKESNRVCGTCNTYSFDLKDDLYFTKFDCCWKCWIEYIDR